MKKTDIIIITGFTGAGKTTFINTELLKGSDADDTVVILNDFGTVPLRSGTRYVEWRSGCPCCKGQRFFVRDLQNAYYEYLPERIIIELSPMAALSEIRKIFIDRKMTLRFVREIMYVYVEKKEDIEQRMMVSGPFIREQRKAADIVIQR
ncbi:MAG: hypothetical protein IJT63_07430 [Lachnospiraceae bacterium]|nr:hypothetical protein [Lachnospiraceae bacterium]